MNSGTQIPSGVIWN
jgi:hypothetical protein